MTQTVLKEQTQERPSDDAPWSKTEDELLAYLREMLAWPGSATSDGEGYGRCVYAMSFAALATFRYIASQLGVTGFQASCADLDFVVRNRGMKFGALLLDGSKVLYPQYDPEGDALKWLSKRRSAPDIRAEAARLLAESGGHPNVRAHWQSIVDAPLPVEGASDGE